MIVFASEPKNLVGLCDKIMPFPPGHYYKDGKFTCYNDITKSAAVCHDDLETVCSKIHDKLIRGVEKRLVADAKVGFLLSGGLDSSLVCAIAARESKAPIRTFAIGMSEDAIDLKYAKQVADYIGSDHTEVYMTKQQVLDCLEEVIRMLGTYDITTIRASMGMYLLCKWIPREHRPARDFDRRDFRRAVRLKVHRLRAQRRGVPEGGGKRIRELHMYDVLRADRCISVQLARSARAVRRPRFRRVRHERGPGAES